MAINLLASGGVRLKDDDLLQIRKCVHCGLCLPACPTYNVLGTEMDSPRGRIFQMKGLAEGTIAADDPRLRTHLYRCLDCRACQTACPAGVGYGTLIESVRAQIDPPEAAEAGVTRLTLNTLFASKKALHLAGFALRSYQKLGIQAIVRASGLLDRLPALGRLDRMLPPLPGEIARAALPAVTSAEGPRRGRVGLLTGCVMDEFFGETNRSTARVLAANGHEVVIPAGQQCCGALHAHNGAAERGRDLARRNVDAFLAARVDVVVNNAAGCGAELKNYAHALADDPAYADRARELTSRVRDVNELLAAGDLNPALGPVPLQVTYQDACHLVHGQGIRRQPRQLLEAIPGLDLIEMAGSDTCCGSAGIYNVLEPDLAEKILDGKVDAILATGAEAVVVSNPGCLIQISYGLRRRGHPEIVVYHPMDLLARSYEAGRLHGFGDAGVK